MCPLSFSRCRHRRQTRKAASSASRLFSRCVVFNNVPNLFIANRPSRSGTARVLASVCRSVIVGSITKECNVHSVTALRGLDQCLFSASKGLFSIGGITGALTDTNTGTSCTAISGRVDTLRHSFVICDTRRRHVQNGRLLHPRHGFCPISGNFHGLTANFGNSSHKTRLRNVIFVRLRQHNCSIAVKSLPSNKVSFVTGHKGSGRCVRIALGVARRRAQRQRLTPLQQLNSTFPHAILALS